MIAADFMRIATAAKGFPADGYEGLAKCRLSTDAIEALLLQDIDAFAAQLTRQLPAWTGYPESAQQPLFDMAYNFGMGGLMKFPKMLAACAAGDWEMAATECRRNGIGDIAMRRPRPSSAGRARHNGCIRVILE